LRLRIGQQTAASLFFLAFGVAAFWVSLSMPIGTAADMGVGYVPWLLSLGSIAVGVIQLTTAMFSKDRGDAVVIEVQPMLFVTAMIVGFAALLPILGLPLTTGLLVLAAAASGEAFDWRILVLTAIGLAAGSALLFAVVLRLQVPVWPQGWPF
jgi:hypothetical protein